MIVTFHSIDDEGNKIYFNSEGYYDNNIIIFEDKSIENTKIHLKTSTSSVELIRTGYVDMNLKLTKNIKNKCYYKNNLGLEFDFEVLATEVLIKNNKIILEYDMIFDNDKISTHKISILLH